MFSGGIERDQWYEIGYLSVSISDFEHGYVNWGWICIIYVEFVEVRGGSRAAATSKMEHFVIIVNGWGSILDVEAALDPSLICFHVKQLW